MATALGSGLKQIAIYLSLLSLFGATTEAEGNCWLNPWNFRALEHIPSTLGILEHRPPGHRQERVQMGKVTGNILAPSPWRTQTLELKTLNKPQIQPLPLCYFPNTPTYIQREAMGYLHQSSSGTVLFIALGLQWTVSIFDRC